MKRVVLLTMGIALAACARVTSTPAPELPGPLPAQGTPAPAGPIPATPAAGSAGQAGSSTSETLPLRIDSPQDNSTVNSPEVEVRGYTAPGAVITMDETIAIADASGAFAVKVPLLEGPNVLEVLANDAQGNEGYLELTLTYDPQG